VVSCHWLGGGGGVGFLVACLFMVGVLVKGYVKVVLKVGGGVLIYKNVHYICIVIRE